MVAQTIVIAGGTLVDPSCKMHQRANLVIRDGVITSITEGIPTADTIIDAAGAFVCPGFVDMHVHLREPGFEYKETIATGLAAAVRGGFTAVACMPNTHPVCDSVETLQFIRDQGRRADSAALYPVCAITMQIQSQGRNLAPMADLVRLGCRAFSNDGQPVTDAGTMHQAMATARRLGALIIDHCEDLSLTRNGVIHESRRAEEWKLPPLSPLAEEVQIARDIVLSEATGCPVHLAHVSTARGMELIRWAHRRGISVSAEATPHHLTLTVDDIPSPDPNFKMNPPLRSAFDRDALRQGLQEGVIGVIASDHAPHSAEEKAAGFRQAPFGIVGLETTVPLVMDRLYHTGILDMEKIVLALAIRPAQLIGAASRSLTPGSRANISVIDPALPSEINPGDFTSKSRNTPFAGWKLLGGARATVVDGTIKFIRTI